MKPVLLSHVETTLNIIEQYYFTEHLSFERDKWKKYLSRLDKVRLSRIAYSFHRYVYEGVASVGLVLHLAHFHDYLCELVFAKEETDVPCT